MRLLTLVIIAGIESGVLWEGLWLACMDYELPRPEYRWR